MNMKHIHDRLIEAGQHGLAAMAAQAGAQHGATLADLHAATQRIADLETEKAKLSGESEALVRTAGDAAAAILALKTENAALSSRVADLEAQAEKATADVVPTQPKPADKPAE